MRLWTFLQKKRPLVASSNLSFTATLPLNLGAHGSFAMRKPIPSQAVATEKTPSPEAETHLRELLRITGAAPSPSSAPHRVPVSALQEKSLPCSGDQGHSGPWPGHLGQQDAGPHKNARHQPQPLQPRPPASDPAQPPRVCPPHARTSP